MRRSPEIGCLARWEVPCGPGRLLVGHAVLPDDDSDRGARWPRCRHWKLQVHGTSKGGGGGAGRSGRRNGVCGGVVYVVFYHAKINSPPHYCVRLVWLVRNASAVTY